MIWMMIWTNNRANNAGEYAGRFQTCPYGNGNDNHHKWYALQIMDYTSHNYALRIVNYELSQRTCSPTIMHYEL